MEIAPLHAWDVSPQVAIATQIDLAARLQDRPLDLAGVRHVAGVDVSVKEGLSQAAVVVLTYPELQPVETVRAQQPTTYPYIPGLLSFREGPVLLDAFARLTILPDVFLFDGMGRIHPRRMGIAAHMGVWLDRPTVGCGKTHFMGHYVPPASRRGEYSPLYIDHEVCGAVLCTRNGVKPVYISPGQHCDLAGALALTLACTTRYRLPQPIRLAHQAAGEFAG
ncbi:MAG: endonuclease V [Anaerolineae bacterium]|jgi:deoxyribonuclease V|nr:endonuclease V [Anaerolineae bacterium]